MTRTKKMDVAVIMGSTSDLKVMKAGIDLLKKWKIPTEVKITSAHRTPIYMKEYAEKAKKRGLKVIIAGAGGAAHLPGMTASFTNLPVIGVPIKTTKLKGLDSLLSVVQMPKDVPVATVAIDNSHNAALLALKILALQDKTLTKKLEQYKTKQKNKSIKSNNLLSKFL